MHSFIIITLSVLLVVNALPEFVERVPNGDASSRPDSGITCLHLGHNLCTPGAPRNPFGLDFMAQGFEYTRALCLMDSDGDGLTNGEELGDPCCEWSVDNPIPLRQINLSHPGEAGEDGAREAAPCPSSATPVVPTPTPDAPTATPTVEPSPEADSDSDSEREDDNEDPSATPLITVTPVAPQPEAPVSSPSPPSSSTPPFPVATAEAATTPTPANSDDDGDCFPAHATVLLQDGRRLPMHQLKVGDSVQVADNQFSQIFMFTHRIEPISTHFVQIAIHDVKLLVSKGHFVYANGALVTADSVRVGDVMDVEGRLSPVEKVDIVQSRGLYNPQTLHGDIVVDGVRVSTYTSAVDSPVAHSLLVPLRALYGGFGLSFATFEKGAAGLVKAINAL